MKGSGGDDRIRAAVVDDDDISRAGAVATLRSDERIEVVFDCTHTEAAACLDACSAIDVMLVDAADDRRPVDQFPGVAVVAGLRDHPVHRDATVVVITGHFLDAGLAMRMREVGADFIHHRLDLRDAASFVAVVAEPEASRRPPTPVDHEELAALGITPSSRLHALVSAVEEADVVGVFSDVAPAGELPSHRSREWMRLRDRAARAGRIDARNTDGSPPRRNQSVPSLAQLRRVYAYATRTKDSQP